MQASGAWSLVCSITDASVYYVFTVPLAGSVKGRQGKRRPAVSSAAESGSVPIGKKGRTADVGTLKLPSHGYPTEHPFNKDGYRYILAEPDPHAPFRQVGNFNIFSVKHSSRQT